MKILLKNIIACGVVACVLPMTSYADAVKVINHTKGSYTANAVNPSTNYHSPCSSFLGASSGVITPEYNDSNPFIIPAWAVSSVCSPSCEVNVYIGKSCDKDKLISIGAVSPTTGIGDNVKNLPNAEGYYITKKSKNELTIEGGAKATIFDTMLRKLGM
jgi:hypothetical protein